MTKQPFLYRVIFLQEEKVYEIYARNLTEETLVGFIEAEELVFNENTQVVVDPSEELLKKEFSGVKRTYIPHHLILRIDEVEGKGLASIKEGSKTTNVRQFPAGGPQASQKKED
jgi:hypothetical protein